MPSVALADELRTGPTNESDIALDSPWLAASN